MWHSNGDKHRMPDGQTKVVTLFWTGSIFETHHEEDMQIYLENVWTGIHRKTPLN